MKKLMSILLALVLVLSLATVAFADNSVSYDSVKSFKIENQILKTYTAPAGLKVNETLSFTPKADPGNPTDANLVVDSLTISDSNFNNNAYLSVTVPELTKAGEYIWTITENKGTTPGVSYTESEITVKILVEYDNENNKLVIGNKKDDNGVIWYVTTKDGKKADTFANIYSVGSFTVKKDVIGNMADKNDVFGITVKLTSQYKPGSSFDFAGTNVSPDDWEPDDNGGYYYSKELNYSDASGEKTFSNIPTGVKVSAVTETTNVTGYSLVKTVIGDYTVGDDMKSVNGSEFEEFAIDATTVNAITVVNAKNTTIDTGIALDSAPYFLMLAVACVGMFLLLSKKRTARDY